MGGIRWLQTHNSTKHRVQDFSPGLSEPLTACHQWSDRPWADLCCEGKVVVQANGKRSRAFAFERLVRQGCPSLLFSMSSLWSPCSEGLGMRRQILPCAVSLFAGPLTARVSAFADDIIVFVSRRLDIKAVKKAVIEYERIAEPKSILTKGSWLDAWRGSDTLQEPSHILGVRFGPVLQLERNWSEVQAKGILYRLAVLPLPNAYRLALQRYHTRLLWVCLIWWASGSLKDLHTWADSCRGTRCGDERRVGFFLALSDPKAEGRRKPRGEAPFVCKCRTALRNLSGSSDLSLYRELVMGSASDPLSERRGWTAEEIHSHWNWAPGSRFLNNSEFLLTRRLARNVLPLLGLNFRASLANMPDCARCCRYLKETAGNAFYYCEQVRPFWDHVKEWTVRIESKQVVLLDVGYVVDNVLPPFQIEKRVVFPHDPSCSQNTDLDDAKEGIVWRCKLFSSWSNIVL